MAGTTNHRIPQNLNDWMRQMERRLLRQEKRPTIRNAADIMGPGIAPKAVLIRDWNSNETTFNGFWLTPPGSLNTPDANEWWTGITVSSDGGYGMQIIWNYRSATWPATQYIRKFYPQGTTRGYSTWAALGSGGAPGAHTHPISDVVNLQTSLDAKVPTATTLTAGLGLTGGGDLTASRTFAVDFASSGVSSATQAVRADDARLSNSRSPNGSAGGALAGTYPNPTLAALNSITLIEQGTSPSTPSAGQGVLYFKADGYPYAKGDDGLERRLVPLNPSLHLNPDFEIWQSFDDRPAGAASTNFPADWSAFWSGQTIEFVQDTSDKVSGNYAVKINHPGGASASLHTGINSAFDVAPNDLVTVGAWAKAGTTTQSMNLNVLTKASGIPEFFDGASILQGRQVTLGTTWRFYQATVVVPAGHTRARLTIGFSDAGAGNARTFWVDSTSSSVQSNFAVAGKEPGELMAWPIGINPGTGYLKCDGSVYNIADYPVLGARYGSTFGGDGTTTFGVPTIGDRALVGASGTKAVGTTGGASTVSLVLANMVAHQHNIPIQTVSNTTQTGTGLRVNQVGGAGGTGGTGDTGVTQSGSPSGATGAAFSVQNPYFAVDWYCKT